MISGMATIDPTPITGAAGLVKSHSVTQDGETTVMRTGRDLLDTAHAIESLNSSCNTTKRTSILKGIFNVRGRSQSYSEAPNG